MTEAAINSFFSVWGLTDKAEMTTALTPIMASEFSFADPKTKDPITSVGDLVAYLKQFGTMMPGGSAKPVTIHFCGATCARATLDFCMGDKTMMQGQYFCTFDNNGKMTMMAGFMGLGEAKAKKGCEEEKEEGEKTEIAEKKQKLDNA